MARKRQKSADVGINMTPMIDIVFQLITFFLLVSQFASAEIDPRIVLPDLGDESKAVPRQQVMKLVVNLMAYDPEKGDEKTLEYVKAGTLNVTNIAREQNKDYLDVLRDVMQEQKEKVEAQEGKLILVLRAHNTLAWSHVQEVMIAAARLQIQDVRLAAPLGTEGYKMLTK